MEKIRQCSITAPRKRQGAVALVATDEPIFRVEDSPGATGGPARRRGAAAIGQATDNRPRVHGGATHLGGGVEWFAPRGHSPRAVRHGRTPPFAGRRARVPSPRCRPRARRTTGTRCIAERGPEARLTDRDCGVLFPVPG